ncbi:MAG: alpha/beta hydrolase, partial [Actinomycetota bacterium]|nr:alpha/beta hydrolase [Actinomycetota bacterium]
LPTVHAGRSSGARVACRCAGPAGATGVVALAFPVHPPGRPDRSRLSEVAAVTVPLLVVQGDRDAFGSPPGEFFADDGRRLVTVAGADHSLRQNTDAVAGAVVQFLGELAGQIDASRAG